MLKHIAISVQGQKQALVKFQVLVLGCVSVCMLSLIFCTFYMLFFLMKWLTALLLICQKEDERL